MWRAFGDGRPEGALARALVQLAAAALQREAGSPGARRLAARARERLRQLPDAVLGVRVRALEEAVRQLAEAPGGAPLRALPLDEAALDVRPDLPHTRD